MTFTQQIPSYGHRFLVHCLLLCIRRGILRFFFSAFFSFGIFWSSVIIELSRPRSTRCTYWSESLLAVQNVLPEEPLLPQFLHRTQQNFILYVFKFLRPQTVNGQPNSTLSCGWLFVWRLFFHQGARELFPRSNKYQLTCSFPGTTEYVRILRMVGSSPEFRIRPQERCHALHGTPEFLELNP
jgi:hypothetical protein